MEARSQSNARRIILGLIILVLVISNVALLMTNVASYLYFTEKIEDRRQLSSFVEWVSKRDSGSLIKCLDDHDIEHKVQDGKILIREVDERKAVFNCS
jgi:uncharacterized membrane protein YqhA